MRRRRDLDRMVEAVLAGRALPSGHLDETEAAVLRAAIELRAARPGADHPDEAFVTDLRRRVHDAVSEPAEHTGIGRRGLLAGAAAAWPPVSSAPLPSQRSPRERRRSRWRAVRSCPTTGNG